MQGFGFLNRKEREFPAMVVVEITNICNSACIHCPYTLISRQPGYRPRHMSWELYQRIVDEVSLHPGVLFRLLCDGEPTLHPRFLDMLSYAKDKEVAPLNFITNGTRLSKELAEKILDLGVDVVEVSLDALNKSTYQKIRVGCDFELVTANLRRLIEMRDQKGARTKIFVSIIDQKESEGELQAFVDYWGRKVDRVLVRPFTTIGGLLDEAKLKFSSEGDRWPCPLLWKRMFINVDGLAEFCVEDWKDETVIGDANQTRLEEIWASAAYNKLRELHVARRFDDVDYCRRCRDWKAREWGNDYFFAVDQALRAQAASD